MRRSDLRLAVATGGLVFLSVTPAEAQWYAGAFFGATHTVPATVSVDAPSQGLAQEFHDVHFDARSFSSPPYYGWRVGRGLGHRGGFSFGLEFEFIHDKVYADTSRTYVVTPSGGGAPVTSFAPMDASVQRFAMSHGLNFALANLVVQAPLHPSAEGRVSLAVRAGVGPTIPHAESTVLGESAEQYEYGGMAFGAGIGVQVRLAGRLSGTVDYKFTGTRPEITLAHGTGRTNALTHHVIAGVLVRLTN